MLTTTVHRGKTFSCLQEGSFPQQWVDGRLPSPGRSGVNEDIGLRSQQRHLHILHIWHLYLHLFHFFLYGRDLRAILWLCNKRLLRARWKSSRDGQWKILLEGQVELLHTVWFGPVVLETEESHEWVWMACSLKLSLATSWKSALAVLLSMLLLADVLAMCFISYFPQQWASYSSYCPVDWVASWISSHEISLS